MDRLEIELKCEKSAFEMLLHYSFYNGKSTFHNNKVIFQNS